MANKPTYEELEQRVKKLEKEVVEHKRAEEALRESEQLQKAIIQLTPDMIFRFNRDAVYTYFKAPTDFSTHIPENSTGKSMHHLMPKKLIDERMKLAQKAWEIGEPIEHEYQFIVDDEKRYRWAKYVRWSDDEILVAVRDISERKQAEEALRESEEKYRSMMEAMDEAVYICSQDYRVEYMNPAMVKRTGWDAIGELCYKVINELDEKCPWCVHNKVQQGESFETEIVSPKDGRSYNISHSPIFHEDGSISKMTIFRDITERKEADEALRESEERYRTLVEAGSRSGQAIVLVQDTDQVEAACVFANDAAPDITGYSKDELAQMSWLDIVHPLERDSTKDRYKARMRGETISDVFEISIIKKGGTEIPIELASIITEFQGKEALVVLFRDIRDRKQAEKDLRESEEKYRTILESIEESYFEVDIAGNFTFFNDFLSRSLGYSNDELMEMNNRDYMSPEASKKIYNLFNQIYRTGNPIKKVVYKIIRKDGSRGFHELSASLIKNQTGQPIGFRGIAHDITEFKRAEDALRESKENLDKAQKMAHIGNWSRDLNLNRAQWSDEMYRIFGLTPGDPAEISFEFILSLIHPEDRERVTSVLKEAAEKKQAFDFEYRTVPIEGSEKIIRVRGEVEYDETGNPVRLFGTNQDITETRRFQAQLQESQKTEAIATLAGGIAHQFNNALTPIIGHISLLEMAHGQDEKIMGSLKHMKASGLHMADLTSQLLAYSRGGKYNLEILSLNSSLRDTLASLQHTLDPLVHVETDLPLDVMNIKADGTQMQMVLSAIMSNSNEAMEGPGRIRISTRNMDLEQELIKDYPGLKPGPYVCLSIEDDGKGMDEETRRRIFEPFFTTHFMGRGLGMAAVYGIIKNHDGAITVDSELGKGTVVRIYLPAIEAEKEVKKKTVSRPDLELPTGDATILVIEDEEDIMMLFRQVLERLGYRVLQAETGKKAIRLAKTFDGQIDLAILDIKLPDMTGDKVYPLIMAARPDLKVIVCSGYTIEGPPQEILDAGAEGFVQKPFHIATLAGKLKEALEGKEAINTLVSL